MENEAAFNVNVVANKLASVCRRSMLNAAEFTECATD